MSEIKVCNPVSVPASLIGDLADLRAAVERLRTDNEKLRTDNEKLRADNERLQQQLQQAQQQLQQAQRASKRQAAPFSKGEPKNQPRTPGRKAGTAHGRHGHRPAPTAERIDEILEARLPEACTCGGSIRPTDVAHQFQTEIPRRPIVRQFNVQRGCCTACGKSHQGRHPLQTSDALGAAASQVGPDAQAAVVLLNKTFGVSHAKIATLFGSFFGINLTRGASAQIVLRAGERLEPAYAAIEKQIADAERVAADETGWRIGGLPAWLHAWASDEATCYHIGRGRSADALEDVIGLDWAGILQHDGFASYDRFTKATHQQCLAHIIRRCRDLWGQATSGGAVRFPRDLVNLFTGAIHLRNEYLAGRVPESEWESAFEEYEERLVCLVLPAREVPEYKTLRKHLRSHQDEWLAFLGDIRIEPTNWEGEQAIRPAVVNRKVWGGNRTENGARAQEILMSVLRTCWQQKRAPLEFVSQTLAAFGNHRATTPALFTGR